MMNKYEMIETNQIGNALEAHFTWFTLNFRARMVFLVILAGLYLISPILQCFVLCNKNAAKLYDRGLGTSLVVLKSFSKV